MAKRKETVMAEAQWEHLDLYRDEYSGFIDAPENIPHSWGIVDPAGVKPPTADETGRFPLQVYGLGYYTNGTIPDDPPVKHQAPGYHRAISPDAMPQPQASYREDGTPSSSGWTGKEDASGQVTWTWVVATPEKELTPEQKAAKIFHDALANPASLIKSAGPSKVEAFAATVLDAARSFLFP